MKLSAWLFLLALVLVSFLYGMFRGNIESLDASFDTCAEQALDPKRASPLLCGEKISLREASAYDFAALPGISLKTARLIVAFIEEHPDANHVELLELPGIGPKTLARLQSAFR